ncbi:MAG: Mini-ribonuclease 3 [Emergencia timonensis]|uniref:Mini-ribonuclease 3 n=1 Tax=Emergencia timonensis TaxID=1776384 RepID=UPI000831EE88|nr:ribonuclease III domain-containing protein [Emergencia timonensis]WNX88571.1 ribonuclease III domain-containing protein [Emergencia timonensis]
MEKLNPREINTTALAFLGDAVYEIYARKYVMDSGQQNADRLHKAAIKYVCAAGQAKAVKSLMADFLSEEEVGLIKRARNRKTASKARSADAVTYKLATAFEALMGFLYLDGQAQRLEEVVLEALKRIEE